MHFAHSVMTVKSIDEDGDERVITGIASTPAPDRVGDVVEPMGARFKTPMPLLWQHKHDLPVGLVEFAQPTPKGIPFRARLPKVLEPGVLKDRVDEAWQSIKHKLVTGVSVGFKPVQGQVEVIKGGGLRFKAWDWFELSLVTIPAQVEATILTIKSLDARQLAASGHTRKGVVHLQDLPGVSGPEKPKPTTPERPENMNIQELIASFEAKRKAAAERMETIITKSAEEGRTLDEAETEDYDTLSTELKSIDEHLERLRVHEKTLISKAVPVTTANTSTERSALEVRSGAVITVQRSLPKGTAFTRYAMALMAAKGNLMQAHEISKRWHESTPEVESVLKAAVAAGSTTDPTFAAPLVEYQDMAGEFIELLRPQTIVGRIQGLRRVPFNIRMPGQNSGSSVGWVGEGRPKPVSRLSFDTTTLRFTKIAGIVVLTDELVRFSNPSAEALVQQDLTATIAQFSDEQFIDPAVAEVANVSPASVTNGVAPIPASGTNAAALRRDVRAVFGAFIAANMTPTNGVWIMSNTQALAISQMQNALGQDEFPGLTMNGGTFMGLPVITSESAGNVIALVNASEVLLADDGDVVLDASREASLQMDDAPGTGAQTLVSLWQNNMVGLRAERFINWKRRRPAAVQYITGAAYTADDATV